MIDILLNDKFSFVLVYFKLLRTYKVISMLEGVKHYSRKLIMRKKNPMKVNDKKINRER